MNFYLYGHPLARGTKIAPKGESLRFFSEVVLAYDGDECLTWPYGRTTSGYGRITVDRKMNLVHRLLCTEIHGPPPAPEYHAAHSCGKGHLGCVAKKHLSWKTPAENSMDQVLHGTKPRGERHAQAKITEAQAREIIALKGKTPKRIVAQSYGISVSLVAGLQARRTWKWMQP
jgi:hypothetical protein